MFEFLKKLTSKKSSQEQKNGTHKFMRLHYEKVIAAVLILIIVAGFYLIIMGTYSTLINPQPPKQSEIISEKKKINITQYEETYENLQDKQTLQANTPIPHLFR